MPDPSIDRTVTFLVVKEVHGTARDVERIRSTMERQLQVAFHDPGIVVDLDEDYWQDQPLAIETLKSEARNRRNHPTSNGPTSVKDPCVRLGYQKGEACREVWPEDQSYWCHGCKGVT